MNAPIQKNLNYTWAFSLHQIHREDSYPEWGLCSGEGSQFLPFTGLHTR